MSTNGEEFQEDAAVWSRVNLPGWLLILVGILNVLAGLYLIQRGIQAWKKTPAEIRAEQEEMAKNARQLGLQDERPIREFLEMTPEQVQSQQVRLVLGWAALALVGAFVITYGGFNLRSLNSYGLAVAGAILAMVPVVSPLGCCGIGQIVGVWALAVLLSRDVRAAFP